jgi:uncharacterized coiled-coil DUF342 family protein
MEISELKKKAEEINSEMETTEQIIRETDDARRKNDSSYHKRDSLRRKYYKIMEDIQHLDRYDANKELQKIVGNIMDSAEEDWHNFKFFEKAEANFVSYGRNGRELHVKIICSQVCDDDVMKVIADAEKVTKRKVTDWFVSASIGYNPSENARAWLTYHLTFKGEKNKRAKA